MNELDKFKKALIYSFCYENGCAEWGVCQNLTWENDKCGCVLEARELINKIDTINFHERKAS